MTCTADRVLDNIRWRLESLATHTDTDATLKDFVWYDRDELNGEVSSGMTRGFTFELSDGTPEEDNQGVWTDAVQQWSLSLTLRIAYYKHGDWLELQKLIQRDRFDVTKRLRNTDLMDGTPSDSSFVDEAKTRVLKQWRIVEAGHALYLDLGWSINVIEDE